MQRLDNHKWPTGRMTTQRGVWRFTRTGLWCSGSQRREVKCVRRASGQLSGGTGAWWVRAPHPQCAWCQRRRCPGQEQAGEPSYISVSARRLSPSPDVIRTIWELGAVVREGENHEIFGLWESAEPEVRMRNLRHVKCSGSGPADPAVPLGSPTPLNLQAPSTFPAPQPAASWGELHAAQTHTGKQPFCGGRGLEILIVCPVNGGFVQPSLLHLASGRTGAVLGLGDGTGCWPGAR